MRDLARREGHTMIQGRDSAFVLLGVLFPMLLLTLQLGFTTCASAAPPASSFGLGRTTSAAEIQAWDIAIGPEWEKPQLLTVRGIALVCASVRVGNVIKTEVQRLPCE